MKDIRHQFDAIAEKYDRQRRQLIPCFDDFYGMALSVMNSPNSRPRILDIGSGTGLFAAMALEKFPEASMTLIDLSPQMLNVAQERFENRSNVRFIQDDYTTREWHEEFDIVISGLSIHHLPHQGKKALFARIFKMLAPGGIFVNADQSLGATPEMEAMYSTMWKKSVESSGLPTEEIVRAYERTRLDSPSSMEDQLSWLREAGFSHAECVYKYWHFSVFFAVK